MFKRITIIGLGLIGGSLAKVIKAKHLAKQVVGVSRRKSTIQKAKSLKIVDLATLDLKEGVKDSDLIILCSPVLTIIDLAKKIAPFLKKGAIVTDAGSTKENIVKEVKKVLGGENYFVGSHPIAGSEKSGIIYGNKELFRDAYCVIIRAKNTNKMAFNKVERFWKAVGMKTKKMTAKEHDRIVSRLSHLPHIVSVALVNSSGDLGLSLAAGGFKDTTRIASGSPELWGDIFVTNRANIIKDIRSFKKELKKLEKSLIKNNEKDLKRLLEKAKKFRDSIL
ncbi:MAG: prephenate dehydrogenase [Candidatus Omnitrophota bacterium]